MFNRLTEEDFAILSKQHQRVMVYKEILGDQITPVQVFQALDQQMKGATLLESNPKEKTASARYSFLGFTQVAVLTIKNNHIECQDAQGTRTINALPLEAIRQFYQENHAVMTHSLAGFAGGIAGFFAYDAARLFEEKLQHDRFETDFPDIVLKSYRDHILFDLETGQVVLATLAHASYAEAIERLEGFYKKIITSHSSSQLLSMNSDMTMDDVVTSMDDATYIKAAEKAKEHIKAGDAFQIVLARTFETPYHAKPFDLYRVLRFRNPSPYMFYLDNDDFIVFGASPEKMVSVTDNRMQSCPLAGTRPRGAGYNDEVQEADLLADTKELSEHMMLVDLARNDMGAVAKPGGVSVTALKQIKKFSHVMHISSTVEAQLDNDKDALDALRAAFPAGTLSGAPKIRAMQIIDELEGKRRTLYGGAIGFLNSKGDFDSCIAIRMAILKDGKAFVTAGAGIVADSDLQKEADETRHKVRAVLEAIICAERGLS